METFQYTYSNLSIYHFDNDWILFTVSIICGLALMSLCYIIIRNAILYTINYTNEQTIAKKKKTLGDLILMKDIQTELEKEIEQAILKAAFHS